MKKGTWRGAVVAMIVATMMAGAVPARADGEMTAEGIGWSKLLDYAACGVAIATIETGWGLVAASIACGKATADWWTE